MKVKIGKQKCGVTDKKPYQVSEKTRVNAPEAPAQ
jgi:hypothetical protein